MVALKTIKSITARTSVSPNIVKTFLSVELGSKWIVSKKLETSEVELSMFLKSLRKMLYNEYLHKFSPTVSEHSKFENLNEIFSKYRQFHSLHSNYYQNRSRKSLHKIRKLLGSQLIFDLGISRTRLKSLLPQVLSKISPAELELLYSINSLYRLEIAKFLQEQIKTPFFIRGSLLFFNARSFGIGYSANFITLEASPSSNLRDVASGSDLDLRVLKEINITRLYDQIRKIVETLYQKEKRLGISLNIELACMKKNSTDDIFPVSKINQLINAYFSSQKIDNLRISKLPSVKAVRNAKLRGRIDHTKLFLTKVNLTLLLDAFITTIKMYGANDETVRTLSSKWQDLLMKARRETDFHGLINLKTIKEAYTSLLLFSGYRFSKKDSNKIFNQMILAYYKNLESTETM